MASWPALTMPMSMPALMAWYRNTAWIASRTGLLPRNEKETLDTPPETSAWGRVCLICAGRLDEVDGVVVVLLDAGGDGEDVRVEDDVLGGKPTCSVSTGRRGCRSRPCAPWVSAWPTSSKAMTMTAAP
jgi:hypothetical protein